MCLFLLFIMKLLSVLITIVFLKPKSLSKLEKKNCMNYFLLVSFEIKINFSFTCKINK